MTTDVPVDMTLPQMLARVVSRDPAAPAVIDDTPDALTTSYGDLWRRAVTLRDDLLHHDVREGDCVCAYLPNWSDFVVWQFAAAGVGAHLIGINTRYGVGDVAHLLDRAQPVVVAVAHDFRDLPFGQRLREGLREAGIAAPSVAVVTGPGLPAAAAKTLASYDLGAGAWAPTRPDSSMPLNLGAFDGAPDALAVAFTTSGSTGKPKLAAHIGSHVVHHSYAAAEAADLGPDSRTLLPLPLSGVLAFSPAYATLAVGGTLIMQPSFDGPHAVELMERHQVSHLTSADDIGLRIKDAWTGNPRDLSAFRRWLFGDFYGQSLQVAEWLEEHTRGTATSIYGSSEVLALLTLWRGSDAASDRWLGGGRVSSPRAELRIVDPVTKDEMPAGQSGELVVRGYSVVDAYLGDSDGAVMRRNVDSSGWFRTGDLCHLRPDGALVYQCRMGDSLRLKGFLVEPIEIESVIAQLPEVAVVKVVGIEGDAETRAICFVTAADGAQVDPEAVRRHCLAQLARYKVPEFVHVVDQMPTTRGANGMKIRAAALRELATELHGSTSEGAQ